MVEQQPSKLNTRVRFPSPAPSPCVAAGRCYDPAIDPDVLHHGIALSVSNRLPRWTIVLSLTAAGVIASWPIAQIRAEAASPNATCAFRRLEILPTDQIDFTRFAGRGNNIGIEFKADFGRETDVFPDPPAVVNRSTNKSCNIEEGGIWLRRQVYITADESHLLSDQYSGSWEVLVVYDTGTCARLGEMKLDRRLVGIDRSTVSVETDCAAAAPPDSCVRKFSVGFDRHCVPRRK